MKRVLVLLLAGGWFASAAADNAALMRCRGISDPVSRLACYDGIPLLPGAGATAPAAPQAPTPPAATFGLESRAVPTQAVLPSIESAVDGPFDGWLPRGQLKLTNGQVWEITDGSTAAYDLKSPKVKITRGVSGSFFMAIEGVAQTPRVRRVK
jgi:hypothetical protein